MDKYEYRVKLDEINNLVDSQDYVEALKIVETIDWRRVKSARTLCMVAEIYEANKKYRESREILLLAYERAPIGKTVLYHLVELAIKMGDLDDAVEYYHEFAAASPNDNNKYILKYKIYRARKSPIRDQIAILEEYKEREYTERWAYELARLYAKAGMREKCIEECDDLILWFSEGRFVTKAMELKMTYTSLNPVQMEKYQNRYHPSSSFVYPGVKVSQPRSGENGAALNTDAEMQKKIEEAEAEAAKELQQKISRLDNAGAAAVDAANVALQRGDTVDLQDKIAKGIRDVFSGREGEPSVRAEGEQAPESTEGYLVKDLEPEDMGHSSVRADQLSSAILNAGSAPSPVKVPKAKPFVLPEEYKTEKDSSARRLKSGQINMADYDVDIDAIIAETTEELAQELHKETQGQEQKEPSEEEVMQTELAAAVSAMMQEEEPVSQEEPETIEESAATEEIAVLEEEETAEDETQESKETVPVFSGPEEEHETEDLGITKALNLEEKLMKALEEPEEEVPEKSVQERPSAELKAVQPATNAEIKLLRHRLTEEEQKQLFTYFAPIPGMREQLVDTLDTLQESARERTSRSGNIMVVGRPGSGKTHLSECLVKAICKERKMEAAKVAYLEGSAMNSKDPAAVVAKLAGGFLVIEKAGDMEPQIVQKLSQAMDFKTNGLVVILEDEKQAMRDLAQDYPELAKKFSATVTVPVFTNDELVYFAKAYAGELGYHMDEMGVLALYTLIGDNQTENEPVTVGQVKEMMDRAIYRSQKGGRKLGRKISKRLVDEQNRIILYEKDFDM